MNFAIECEREDDGRWIADVVDLPGVMVYGDTLDDAVAKVQILALPVLADKLEAEEVRPLNISFSIPGSA